MTEPGSNISQEQPRRPGQRGRRLDAAVRERFDLSWRQARQRIERGQIWIQGAPVTDIGFLLEEDALFEYVAHARAPVTRRTPLPPEAIVFVDRDLAVVDKPAALLTVPYERGDRDTLDQLLTRALHRQQVARARREKAVHVVHRLDRGTSGLLVFARTTLARDRLKDQLREHSVHRRYIALAQGRVTATTVTSHLVRDRGDGKRGSVEHAPARLRSKLGRGKLAITHIEVLERLADATLISCRLETGRTNQIRIHLAELGHPLVGETVYASAREAGPAVTSRLCLHAAELGFLHPRTGAALSFRSAIPPAMEQEIKAQR